MYIHPRERKPLLAVNLKSASEVFKKAAVICDQLVIRTSNIHRSLLMISREMEANSTAFKNPLSLAVGPVKIREESPKRKTPFMVDDLVRDPNILMSAPCSRNLPDSSFQGRVQKPIDGGTLSKPGKIALITTIVLSMYWHPKL